jgi:hypothetical protein
VDGNTNFQGVNMKRPEGNWSDFLDHPAHIRRLFPRATFPLLSSVRFERLVIKSPKEIVLGVTFNAPLPDAMQFWIDKGYGVVDLRLTMTEASVISIDCRAMEEQPLGDIQIESEVLRFTANAKVILEVRWSWLSAKFLPEKIDRVIQDDSDTNETIIGS